VGGSVAEGIALAFGPSVSGLTHTPRLRSPRGFLVSAQHNDKGLRAYKWPAEAVSAAKLMLAVPPRARQVRAWELPLSQQQAFSPQIHPDNFGEAICVYFLRPGLVYSRWAPVPPSPCVTGGSCNFLRK
jgi:hypothetical protein